MKRLLRHLVCMFAAVALIAIGAAGAGLIASPAAMTGPDAAVNSDSMKCGPCASMPGALATCTASQCVVTGIDPGAKVTAGFQRVAYRVCSEPMPRGCHYRPFIFPS